MEAGIDLASHCRSPSTESPTNTNPSTKTAVSARLYETGPDPWNPTTVYVKYAFRPIPGARAIGMFAQSPIMTEVRAAMAAVPVTKSRWIIARQDW